MFRFHRLNIRLRILAGFGALLLLLIVNSLVNMWSYEQNANLTNQLITNENRLNMAELLNYYTRTANSSGANEILSPYPSVQQQYDKEYNQNVDEAGQLLQQMRNMTQSGPDAHLLNQFQDAWADFQSITDSALGFLDEGRLLNARVIYSQVPFSALAQPLEQYSNHQIESNRLLMASLESDRARTNIINWIFTLVALFIGVWVSWLVSARISSAIFDLQEFARKIASGDLSIRESSVKHTDDELGDLAHSMEAMSNNLSQVILGVKEASSTLTNASVELNEDAELASDATKQVSTSVKKLATGAKTQLAHHSQSAASMGEIATGLKDVADLTEELADITEQSQTAAEKGQSRIHQAYAQMERINEEVEITSNHVETLNVQSQKIGWQ